MDTEPPGGDELQRMLVSMKQTVLERATPRPRRRRRRTGVVVGVVALLAVGTATGAVALTLSQQDRPVSAPVQSQESAPGPSATTPSSAPITATPTPRPTPTSPRSAAAATIPIPAPCSALVPQSEYLRLFGAARLIETVFDGDRVGPSTPQERIDGLTAPDAQLSCDWQNEGSPAELSIMISRRTPEEIAADEQVALRYAGGRCEDQFGGRVCSFSNIDELAQQEHTVTIFARDGIVVNVDQADFPTNGLLPAVVGEIWGD